MTQAVKDWQEMKRTGICPCCKAKTSGKDCQNCHDNHTTGCKMYDNVDKPY